MPIPLHDRHGMARRNAFFSVRVSHRGSYLEFLPVQIEEIIHQECRQALSACLEPLVERLKRLVHRGRVDIP